MSRNLAIVLHSGTKDRLHFAATMISGAAAMGREVDLFLTFWGVEAFRKDRDPNHLPMSTDFAQEAKNMEKVMAESGAPNWREILDMAVEIGEVRIHACPQTLDFMQITQDDLDPIVDDIIGIATFMSYDAEIVFM